MPTLPTPLQDHFLLKSNTKFNTTLYQEVSGQYLYAYVAKQGWVGIPVREVKVSSDYL